VGGARGSWPGEARRFGDLLGGVIKAKRFCGKTKYSALTAAWQGIVGEEIASRTRIVNFEHGRVTVEVTDSTLQHELGGFMRAVLLEQLQRTPGGQDVAELRFRLGSGPA